MLLWAGAIMALMRRLYTKGAEVHSSIWASLMHHEPADLAGDQRGWPPATLHLHQHHLNMSQQISITSVGVLCMWMRRDRWDVFMGRRQIVGFQRESRTPNCSPHTVDSTFGSRSHWYSCRCWNVTFSALSRLQPIAEGAAAPWRAHASTLFSHVNQFKCNCIF